MPSKAVLDRAEDVYQAMKKNRKNIVKRYGKEAENVMRGRAMNIAKKQVKTMNEDKLKEIIKKRLSTPPVNEKKGKDLNNDNKIDSKDYLLARKNAIEKVKAKKTVKEDHGCTTCDSHNLDYEGEMAKAELYKLIQSAKKIFSMLDEDAQLEAWVQSKITKATDYLNSVEQYLEYQSVSHHSPNLEEKKLVYYLDK
jgi:hypothetical protein